MPGDRQPATNSRSARLALLLAWLATLIFEVAASDGERPAWLTALVVAGELAALCMLGWAARRWEQGTQVEHRSRLCVAVGLALTPFLIELGLRWSVDHLLPLELLLLSLFRNGVLALAVFAHRLEYQRMTGSLATFLAIFASSLTAQFWLHGLVVVFAVVGIWWLMGSYWDTLQGRLASTSQREISPRWLLVLVGVVLPMLAGLPVTGMHTRMLSGFMPSSGGQDWYAAEARSGVGDGDHLVAGTEHIQSFAPIEDAPFRSSHEPSLYDLFDETYNEPAQPRKTDRAIALPPQPKSQPQERELASSRQAGKEFSTLRKSGKLKQSSIGDRDSRALLYVKGRTPLHLKLEVFDRYDGIDWFPEELPEHSPQLTMETLHSRPWIRLPTSRSLDIYGSPESHALKIIRLDTNRIPAPTQLLGLHVDQLHRADFFLWAQPGIVRLDRDTLPSLTTFHVQSRVVDQRRLPQAITLLSGGASTYRQYGTDAASARVKQLAEHWTVGLPKGWPEIQAVVSHIQSEYRHDPAARPPEDCQHTAAHFLLESRRGPDYQFASATVQMLRSLGYSARLVSGFYAHPARYEARSRHTPVLQDDVHFWVEVYAGAGDWIPLEPTPGYALLLPPPTRVERCLAMLCALRDMIVAHSGLLMLSMTTVTIAVWYRQHLADLLATAIWRWSPVRDERERIRRTLHLLLRRCRRAGCDCPRGVPPTRWLEQLCSRGDAAERDALRGFLRLADWAGFAPAVSRPTVAVELALCDHAVRRWSLETLRTCFPIVPAESQEHKADSQRAGNLRISGFLLSAFCFTQALALHGKTWSEKGNGSQVHSDRTAGTPT